MWNGPVKWKCVRRLNEVMAADPVVSATVIQTVGAEGYDGFAITVVGEWA
ncbi:MAG: hypothetical protein WCF33_05850 [Pseudonocardiaceae bacterium]